MAWRGLSDAGVSFPKFKAKMRLGNDAADFVSARRYGAATVWLVLYQKLYSLVTFTAANLATCISPDCRRFRGRCGHMRLARSLQAERRSIAAATGQDGPKLASAGKTPRSGLPADAAPFISSAEEDEGLEKLPSGTLRSATDSDEIVAAKRVPCNLIPCAGERAQADVWARTADWCGLPTMRARPTGTMNDDVQLMYNLYDASVALGHIRDPAHALVELRCGSCGLKRQERHKVENEPAILYSHHPSAPTLSVSSACCPILLLALCVAVMECPLCTRLELLHVYQLLTVLSAHCFVYR